MRKLFVAATVGALALTGCQSASSDESPSTTTVSYASCEDAPGPLKVGDPGYSLNLDRDGDGSACE